MELYPAIDLKDGQCVRLLQGAFDTVHKVADDPVVVAAQYRDAGADIIHVVDLDGARGGIRKNENLVRAIVKAAAPAKVELGGGLRSLEDLAAADSLGVHRFVIGSAAVQNPDFVCKAVSLYGDRIAVGIDAKEGQVRCHGWTTDTGLTDIDLVRQMVGSGVRSIIYTDIATDGTLEGPSLDRLKAIRAALPSDVALIASGGVAGLSDLQALRQLEMDGVIAGKALYAGILDLSEGLAECRCGHLFEKQRLVPAIIQHDQTGQVLMLGYMNIISFERTVRTKRVVFWSRSRRKLWLKGETSGNYLNVRSIYFDCDKDTFLIRCIPDGPTCHTGNTSCFFTRFA